MSILVPFYNRECHIEYSENGRGHTYLWVEKNKFLPGPTSILDEIWEKGWKAPWMKKVSCAYFREQCEAGRTDWKAIEKEAKAEDRRVSKEATDIGSLVHSFCETYPDSALPDDPQARAACLAFTDWWAANHIEPIEREKIVFSRSLAHAGKTDLFAHVNGELSVVDYKTSKVFGEEWPAQLGGYATAIEEESGEKIDIGWMVRLDKLTGKFEPHRIPLTPKLKMAWRNAVYWYWDRKEICDLAEQVKAETERRMKWQMSQSSMVAEAAR